MRNKHEKLPEAFFDDAPLEGGYYDSSEVPGPDPVIRGAPSKFTPERCKRIIEAVRLGAFLHVACKANGISMQTLRRWRADEDLAKQRFCDELDQACAQARMDAEQRIHTAKPAIWLRLGPGRDTGDPANPGWTTPVKRVEGRHAHAHLHASADGEGARPIDLSGLSKGELLELERITRKLIPAGKEAIAIEVSDEDK